MGETAHAAAGADVGENSAEAGFCVRDGRVGLRLELSSRGRYALRALVYLARLGGQATADRISVDARIPRRLLARILADLSRAGLVESGQGRGGGSRLARPAEEISLRDAVAAAEGPFGMSRCIMQDRACDEGAPCALHHAWEEGQQAILDHLETQTLEDFVQKNPRARRSAET